MRILLVDDHLLLLEGLTNLLKSHDIDVLGEAHDGREALQMARTLHPDIILMDLKMPEVNGLEATRLIKAEFPEMNIVILTTSTEDQDLFDSIKAGACGYLLKSIRGDAFISALRGLEEGFPPFSPGLAARILVEFSRTANGAGKAPSPPVEPEHRDIEPPLSARQREILSLLAEGSTYKEVGVKLGLSASTIKYHLNETIQQLHLENRAQVLAYAARIIK